jgi:phage-related protein
MFNIVFYQDKRGKEPVKDYLVSLKTKKGKDNAVKLQKIQDYIKLLRIHGTMLGVPYVKHLEDDIWELRPLRDRILFFTYDGNDIVFLSQFQKETQKTPKREIKKAEKRMKDYIKRRAKE